MADITPHFRFPFQLTTDGKGPRVNDQDSQNDVEDCVEVVLSTLLGERQELPAYGLPDQVFQENGADLQIIDTVIDQWEPRAEATLSATEIEELAQRVRINMRETNAGA